MREIFILTKPKILTNLDGSNPRKEWWGKYLRYGWKNGKDTLYHPIFSSLWPGLWLDKRHPVRKLYWYEWIDYGIKITWGRIKIFFHYQKLAFKDLLGII